jgi:hypothetical protein
LNVSLQQDPDLNPASRALPFASTNHDFGTWRNEFIEGVAKKCEHAGDAHFLRARLLALAKEYRMLVSAVIICAGPDIAELILKFVE